MERGVKDMKNEIIEKAKEETGVEKGVKEAEKEVTGRKEREVVIPGHRIVESMDYLPGRNCFREGNSIYSKRVGVVYYKGRVIEVIPLSGEYIPEVGDMVIGTVKEVHHSGWNVNINSPYEAFLSLAGVRGFIDSAKTDLSKIYGIGDVIYAEVSEVTPMKDVRISMKDPKTRKFENGRIVRVSTVKIPRVIGKQGSMINTIKDRTGCMISVGQNGVIWVHGEKENLAAKAIMYIHENSQITGLTDHISKLLDEKSESK